MAEELKACRNCDGKCDPTGWMRGDGRQGPECEGCGITTPDVESWNRLMGDQLPSQGGEAVAELSSDEILMAFEEHGFRIEPGASFSAKGQIAQLLNAVGAILSPRPADQVAGSVARDAERYRLYRLGFEDPEKFDAEIDAALSAKP